MRLIEGSSPDNGRVEICDNGQWRAICDAEWSDEEARVVCRQLGRPSYGV